MDQPFLEILGEAEKNGKGVRWLIRQLHVRGFSYAVAQEAVDRFATEQEISASQFADLLTSVYGERRSGQPQEQAARFDGKSLYQQIFPPTVFVIDGFLQPGFTIMASRPKFGKSFLSLQIAIAVATGHKAFGRFEVLRPGKVVFYSLEDGPRRTQDRLRSLAAKDDALENIKFIFGIENKLLSGGAEEIEREVKSYGPSLLILDPFFMLADAKQSRNFVRSEYEEMSFFRKLSAKHAMPVLLVHHTGKAEAEYALDSIIGSTGTTAPMDGWIIFQQKDGRIMLNIGGKDGEGRILGVERDRNGGWRILGDAADLVRNSEYTRVLEILDACGPLKPSVVAKNLNKPAEIVRVWISRMKNAGLLAALPDGTYCRRPSFSGQVAETIPEEDYPSDFLQPT